MGCQLHNNTGNSCVRIGSNYQYIESRKPMKQEKKLSTYVVIGTMLFGMFFGAGNLIFPIQMGQSAGKEFWQALAGFLSTAIGLPFLGILAIGLSGVRGLKELADKVHPAFAMVFSVALYLTIGPLFAIPRTATVPFVVGFEPYLEEGHTGIFLFLFSLAFFALVYYFSLKPGNIVDYIGKYLTPLFLLLLFLLILTSLVNPMGSFMSPKGTYVEEGFVTGFKEGYNTMDALASLAFGIVVIEAIRSRGITKKKDMAKATLISGIFAMALMALIYGLIVYMGGSSVSAIGTFDNGGQVFSAVAQHYFGNYGAVLLAAIIVVACLKTSIGLIISCSEFFRTTFGTFSYKTYVRILTLVSLFVANFGLTNIIQLAVPVLMTIYPLAIVLILLSLLSGLIPLKKPVFLTAMVLTFTVSLVDGYLSLIQFLPSLSFSGLNRLSVIYEGSLPFYSLGLGWIFPAILGAGVGFIYSMAQKE